MFWLRPASSHMYFVVGNISEIIYKKYMSYNTLQDDLKKKT